MDKRIAVTFGLFYGILVAILWLWSDYAVGTIAAITFSVVFVAIIFSPIVKDAIRRGRAMGEEWQRRSAAP